MNINPLYRQFELQYAIEKVGGSWKQSNAFRIVVVVRSLNSPISNTVEIFFSEIFLRCVLESISFSEYKYWLHLFG